jgi:parallel beta-helix repeat protein
MKEITDTLEKRLPVPILAGVILGIFLLISTPVAAGECNYKQCLEKNPTNYYACACCVISGSGNIDSLCGINISSCDKPIGILVNGGGMSLSGGTRSITSIGIKPGCCGVGILVGNMFTRSDDVDISNVKVSGWTSGVLFWDSDYGSMTNSDIFGNDNGITLFNSNNVTVKSNLIHDNSVKGITIESNPLANNNKIFDNKFNNPDNFFLSHAQWYNQWDDTGDGPNIINGPNIGGNYWADDSGTGYSETCLCLSDGFCNAPYTVKAPANIDNKPLCYPPTISISVLGTIENWILPVGTSTNTNLDLQVNSNAYSWAVSMVDARNNVKPSGTEGRMVEFKNGAYTILALHNALNLSVNGGTFHKLTGSSQQIISGSGSQLYDLGLSQIVQYGDSSLDSGSVYRIVITFEGVTL